WRHHTRIRLRRKCQVTPPALTRRGPPPLTRRAEPPIVRDTSGSGRTMTDEGLDHGVSPHPDPLLRADAAALLEEDPGHPGAGGRAGEVRLRRFLPPHGAAGGSARRARDQEGRPGGNARVELAPPPGGVLRGAADGRGPAHRERPPVGP